MKISLVILFFLSTINFSIYATDYRFEDRLYEFRYSLYHDFNEIKKANPSISFEQYLLKPETPVFQGIENRLKTFLKKNEKDIMAYRLVKLKEYESNKIDASNLRNNKPLMKSTINKIPDSFWLKLSERNWMKFTYINPIEQAIKVVGLVIEKQQNIEDFVNLKVVETLARPAIKTLKVKHGWHIIIDKYSTVYTCLINIKTGDIKIINIQSRK